MYIDWHEYEKMKKKLPNTLSPDEYEQAIQAIINKLNQIPSNSRELNNLLQVSGATCKNTEHINHKSFSFIKYAPVFLKEKEGTRRKQTMTSVNETDTITVKTSNLENFACELESLESLCISAEDYAESIPVEKSVIQEVERCYHADYIVRNLLYLLEREILRIKNALDDLLSEHEQNRYSREN